MNQTIAEIIKRETDLKCIEVYRSENISQAEAQEIDDHLTDLADSIIDALDPNNEVTPPRAQA